MIIRLIIFICSVLVTILQETIAQEKKLIIEVKDHETLIPIQDVNITIGNMMYKTNRLGQAAIDIYHDESIILNFQSAEHLPFFLSLSVQDTLLSDTIVVFLKRTMIDPNAKDYIIVSLEDLETDKGTQSFSSSLLTSNDPFLSMALYNLSFCRYSFRGYLSRYSEVYINNIQMSDPETEINVWSEWGGLNDAMRNQETSFSLAPASFSFGSIGGHTSINTRPTSIGRQNKISYAISNRTYNNRITYIFSSGLTKNNWAFTIHGSRRWALQGYVPGTWYDAYSFFAAAEKKANLKHNIAAVFFYTPYRRALQSPATKEAYELVGSNYYNPNWGWQEGKIRNARVRSLHKPTLMLHHMWNINDNKQLINAISYSYTEFGTTALNWYDTPDPRPDYYRYLPSFQKNDYLQTIVSEQWKNDENIRQINWNQLYQINYLQNLENKQAKYIVENRKKTSHTFNFTSNMKFLLSKRFTFFSGIEFQYYRANYFKVIEDLLGGSYWLDVDQFAERDFASDTTILFNNLQNPNKKIKEGDRFGYDYVFFIYRLKPWTTFSYKNANYEAYISCAMELSRYQRQGNMQNGRFPNTSLGKSMPIYFYAPSLKGGMSYMLTGRNIITSNIAYLHYPPLINEIYIIPSISHNTIEEPLSESIFAVDLTNFFSGIKFSYKVSLYRTHFFNLTDQMQFYHDDLRTFVSLTMTEIEKIHNGIEMGFSYNIFDNLTLSSYAAIGDHLYRSRPKATIAYTNNSKPDTVKTIYIFNFYDYTSPQFVLTTSLKYNISRLFSIQLNANYFDKYFMSFNPERRTENALVNLGPDDPIIDQITKQYRFPSGYTLDATVFRSWKINNYFFSLFLSINNLLNNKNIQTGGFEQLRFDFTNKDVNKFPPKFIYAYGRTYFVMLSIRI